MFYMQLKTNPAKTDLVITNAKIDYKFISFSSVFYFSYLQLCDLRILSFCVLLNQRCVQISD